MTRKCDKARDIALKKKLSGCMDKPEGKDRQIDRNRQLGKNDAAKLLHETRFKIASNIHKNIDNVGRK